MAKFCGKVGFWATAETEPGIWTETIVEKTYRGDIVRNISNFSLMESVNGTTTLNNSISIVADPYATQNYQNMRYVVLNGFKWKITSVDLQYPRIVLSVGGEYRGD